MPGTHCALVWAQSVDPNPEAGHDDDDDGNFWARPTPPPTHTGKKEAVRANPLTPIYIYIYIYILPVTDTAPNGFDRENELIRTL